MRSSVRKQFQDPRGDGDLNKVQVVVGVGFCRGGAGGDRLET